MEVNQVNQQQNKQSQPIELALYEEASKRREKKAKLEYNTMMNILLDATKSKISNNSHKIAISKTEKMIDEIIERHNNNEKTISFITLGEILTDLKIFRETFPKDEKTKQQNSKAFNNIKDVRLEITNTKESNKRKQQEINFYEQLWMTINPGNQSTIKTNTISEIIKILFAPVNSNVKDISEIFRQFLVTAFFLNSNPQEVKRYISPITNKDMNENEIWSIEKLVREFLLLKENLLAYKEIKHISKNMKNNLNQNKPSFKPETNENIKGWNYFTERLPTLIERKKLRLQVLNEMKEENEQNDLKECSFKPQINHYEFTTTQNKCTNSKGNKMSIYEKQNAQYQNKFEIYKQQKEENDKKKEQEELSECTFHPKLISQKTYEKCRTSTTKPKGYEEYSQKMREGIIRRAKKKFKENQIPTGENYEKVKNANIQPFDITDLRKGKKVEMNYNSESNNKKNVKENVINEEECFNIQIKIPNGKERVIKVYLNDEPYDIADNFCKTYCLKEEIKERLAKTILNYRNIYLQTRNNANK